MRLELQESASSSDRSTAVRQNSRPAAPAQIRRRAGREDLEAWRNELDEFYDVMNAFANNEETIFHDLSAMSSRASQIRSLVVRQENKALQVFRTQEIDPFLRECDRQFKLWSRVLTVSQHEWEITSR